MIRALSAALLAAVTLIPTAANAAPIPVSETHSSSQVNERAKNTVCKDPLVGVIKGAGFKGQSVRVAWAIAMRESNGHAGEVSPSDDWGLFQLNRPTFGNQPWWSDSAMLDPNYNARMAYKISHKGKSWVLWGLDRYGNLDPTYYQSWGPDLWQAWIIGPFQKYYAQFPNKCK